MKKFLIALVVVFYSVPAFAQTKDEVLVVTTVKTFLTDKDESKVHSLIGSNFKLYCDSSLVNSSALTTFEHYKKPNSRVGIAVNLPMSLVLSQNTASLFCITELFDNTSKEPKSRAANTLFLTKENNVWKVNLWLKAPYKNDYSTMEFGN